MFGKKVDVMKPLFLLKQKTNSKCRIASYFVALPFPRGEPYVKSSCIKITLEQLPFFNFPFSDLWDIVGKMSSKCFLQYTYILLGRSSFSYQNQEISLCKSPSPHAQSRLPTSYFHRFRHDAPQIVWNPPPPFCREGVSKKLISWHM